jgi:glycerol-3-phosphate acyltransferase PlsY
LRRLNCQASSLHSPERLECGQQHAIETINKKTESVTGRLAMDPLITLIAAVGGYLFGSFSSARLIARLFASGQPIGETMVHIPGTDATFKYDAISATTIRLNMGPGYGCLTSVLDMLKAAIPVFAFRLWRPEANYHLIVAITATVGHNWPLYHKFKGGRGMSPILGGMMVVDWLGTLVTNTLALLAGTIIGKFSVTDKLGVLFMVPWLWLRHRDAALTAYALVLNGVLWIAMIPEVRQLARLRREGMLEAYTTATHVRVEQAHDARREDRLTAAGLLSLLFSRWKHDHSDSSSDV